MFLDIHEAELTAPTYFLALLFYTLLIAFSSVFIIKTIKARKKRAFVYQSNLNEPVATCENGAIVISGTIKAMIILKDVNLDGGLRPNFEDFDYDFQQWSQDLVLIKTSEDKVSLYDISFNDLMYTKTLQLSEIDNELTL